MKRWPPTSWPIPSVVSTRFTPTTNSRKLKRNVPGAAGSCAGSAFGKATSVWGPVPESFVDIANKNPSLFIAKTASKKRLQNKGDEEDSV